MSLVTKAQGVINRMASRYVTERTRHLEDQNQFLQESLGRLELEIENEGWTRLAQNADKPIDRTRLGEIIRLCTQMAMKNPITNRSVNVQSDYVFGQGVRFVAKNPDVQAVIDEFVGYRLNRKALTSHTAMLQAERRLQTTGNLFISLWPNTDTGRVHVRNLNVHMVTDIICDPEDCERELFIKCSYNENGVDKVVYYPAYGVTRSLSLDPYELDEDKSNSNFVVEWNTQVIHVDVNRWDHQKFGIPEVWPQIDWALAYKRFLEDWTSIIRSFARMALKITGLAGKKGTAAAKSMLQTGVGANNPNESNPSAAPGSWFLGAGGTNVEAVKTAGATTPASEGLPVLNMAAAAVGLPNTFFGDASVGNYATSKTLDRPTELKMISRQKLWMEVWKDILAFVILWSAKAGDLVAKGFSVEEDIDQFTGDKVYALTSSESDASFEIVFPEILERNVTDRVRALVNAVTLFGKPLTDIVPDKRLVARWLLEAMNIPNVEQLIPQFVEMWTKNQVVYDDKEKTGKPVDPIIIPPSIQDTGNSFGAEDPSQGGAVGSNG